MAVESDLVLIYFEDAPLVFARIEAITPDAKPDWYHVKLLMLKVPTQLVTWILRDVYIDGQEFTMNDKRMRLEKIEAPVEPTEETSLDEDSPAAKAPGNGSTNVISLAELKKK